MKLYQNRDSGFTLVEALATAAILIILLGLSAVGVARWRDPLKITELDNAARAIYMAAENRSILLQNSGAAVSLLTVPDTPGAGDLTPSSATVTQDGEDKTVSLCVLSNATKPAILDELLPVGVIDPTLREGCFYILYDRSTYHVFEVFYAEEKFPETELNGLRDMSRSERVSYYRGDTAHRCLVGHYEGGLAGKIGAKPLPTPGVEVSITNGNELTLTVKYTIPNDLPSGVKYSPSVRLNYPGATPKQDLLSVNNSGMIIPVDGDRLIEADNFDIAQPGDTVTYTWVLDSLEQDGGGNFTKQFKGLFIAPDTIAFGGDFTVTASLGLSADGYISSSFSVEGIDDNSLFAKTPEGGDTNTAYIANLRHLQNLDSDSSGAAGKVSAKQCADIDCAKYIGNNGGVLIDSYAFRPIVNWDLFNYDARRHDETDGEDLPYAIRNLKVTPASAAAKHGAGLFGITQEDFKFQRVHLVHPVITEGGTTSYKAAGALLGFSWNPVIFENCRVDGAAVTSTGAAGGMLGQEDSSATFISCSVEGATILTSGYAGGMAGSGASATFTDCTAKNTTVNSSSFAGGLVGNMIYGFTFTSCQTVNAKVESKSSVVGGMAGYTWSGNITFSQCKVKGSATMNGSSAGGLMGSVGTPGAVTFTGCEVGVDGSTITLTGTNNAGGLVGSTDGSAIFTSCTVGTEGVQADKTVVITAETYAGGLVGNSISGTFTECKAVNAKVTATRKTTSEAGGLVGRTEGWNKDWTENWRQKGSVFQGCTAAGLIVAGDLNAGGLVGSAIDASMMYYNGPCTAKNIVVTATNNAGGLVGASERGAFTDCHAVNATVTAQNEAGGMAGKTEGTNLTNCWVYWDNTAGMKQTDYKVIAGVAGGLVGAVREGGKIEKSFAATLVKGTSHVGGLVGYLPSPTATSTVEITISYADCYLKVGPLAGNTAYAGGLVGAKNPDTKLTLTNVYSAGVIDAEGQGAGLCGGWVAEESKQDLTATNAYAAVRYEKVNGGYALICNGDKGCTTNSYCLNSPWGGVTSYETMCNLNMGNAFMKLTWSVPYNLDGGSRTTYPFPGIAGLPHYGDWPTS